MLLEVLTLLESGELFSTDMLAIRLGLRKDVVVSMLLLLEEGGYIARNADGGGMKDCAVCGKGCSGCESASGRAGEKGDVSAWRLGHRGLSVLQK